jgi:hypothetical protein
MLLLVPALVGSSCRRLLPLLVPPWVRSSCLLLLVPPSVGSSCRCLLLAPPWVHSSCHLLLLVPLPLPLVGSSCHLLLLLLVPPLQGSSCRWLQQPDSSGDSNCRRCRCCHLLLPGLQYLQR